jgi:hypothetical protein
MNDRPTPETDAYYFAHGAASALDVHIYDLARRLERERDEARDELRESIHRARNYAIETAHDLLAEMDALRAALLVAIGQRCGDECPKCDYLTMHLDDCPYHQTESNLLKARGL